MRRIRINLGGWSHDIFIGAGTVNILPRYIKSIGFKGPIVVITDKNVISKIASIVNGVFGKIANEVFQVTIPPGEKSKSLKVFQDLIYQISKKTKTYKPLVIALGGGVVGDLAGFVAATYRRGVPLIEIPTTLLADVDSSIGGKVGIDLPGAKNLVGAFYQPKLVLADLDFLKTLARREIVSGLAEVIKYAIIANANFFRFLEKHIDKILRLENRLVEETIFNCALVKARIVEKDEFDNKDIRIMLNFGHTLGHAIESASNYSIRHGEAVALGMVLASEIAVKLDMLNKNELVRIKNLISRASLSTKLHGIAINKILDSYEYDKKFVSGANRFILPRRIGRVEIVEEIPLILVRTVLRKYVK